ncbi:hypothetical protein ACH5RR_006236 [Cinchona calisaya]|uniref:Uncharacterized protein n=1 Tax=Cinchona calisaya TaxID=153742 RepID=A0ABD3AND5_9GENT
MKIFSWRQSKLHGNQRSNQPNMLPDHLMHETYKEEFSDWPSGLLFAIGTFGNTNNLKDKENYYSNFPGEECQCPSQEHPQEMSHQEVTEQHSPPDYDLVEESKHDLPQEKFFDFPKNLEDERSSKRDLISDNLTSEGKDNHLDKKKNISKKSLSFLLRKAFHCTGKSKISLLLKDPLPEVKLEKSRLEKILRAILKKKIYPQSSTPKTPRKKCLASKHMSESDSEDEMIENTSEGSKWVKTDSDYIVLEI